MNKSQAAPRLMDTLSDESGEANQKLKAILADFATVSQTDVLQVSPLIGGSSHTMVRIACGGLSAVLRMPAEPPRADSLKALAREARLYKALQSTDLSLPVLLHYEPEPDTLGAPFILMEYVDGWMNFGDAKFPQDFENTVENRRALALAMIEEMAVLHRIDYLSVGLDGFGKPEGFLERQVPRYQALLDSYKNSENHPGREIPGMDYVVDWLKANTPSRSAVSIIHGDMGFPNTLFRKGPRAEVAALVDWEVTTIGDPLLDLARAIFSFPGRVIGNGINTFTDLSGYPTREDLVEHYASVSDFQISNFNYYLVLSIFKLVALIEWNYARYRTGRDSSGLAKKISDFVLDLMTFAEDLARKA